MDFFASMSLLCFWVLNVSVVFIYAGSERSPKISSVLKMNEGLTGVERYERESIMTEFWVNFPFKSMEVIYYTTRPSNFIIMAQPHMQICEMYT